MQIKPLREKKMADGWHDYVMCKPYKCFIYCRQYIRQEMAVEIACLASSEGLFSGLYYSGLVLLRTGFVKSILGPVFRLGLVLNPKLGRVLLNRPHQVHDYPRAVSQNLPVHNCLQLRSILFKAPWKCRGQAVKSGKLNCGFSDQQSLGSNPQPWHLCP